MSQWEMVRLNKICDLQNGYAFKSNDYVEHSNTLNCRMSNIRPNGSFSILYNAKYLPDEYYQKYENFRLSDGDVIIAMTDMANEPKILGVPTIVKTEGYHCLLNQRVGKLTFDDKKIRPDYLSYVLNRSSVKKYYQKFSSGGLQLNLGKKDLLSVKIPLPPIEIQQKIAKTLDTAADLLKLRKQQLAELDKLIQSVFYEMFGDPVRNEKGWEIYNFERIIDFMTSGSRGWAKYYSEQGEFFITIKNVKSGKLIKDNMQKILAPNNKEALRTKVQENDLLISITADLGRTAVVDKDTAQNGAFINQHLCLIRLDLEKIVPIFLAIFLESPGGQSQFQKKNQVGVKSGLNFEAIKSLRIPIPPLSLQTQFAAIVEKIEQQKALVQQSIDETQTLSDSLMSQYFD